MVIKLSRSLEGSSLLDPSQLFYLKGLGICNVLLTLSHYLQIALNRGMEGRLVQLNFSTAFDKVRHRALFYKLRSIGVEGQFLSIVL